MSSYNDSRALTVSNVVGSLIDFAAQVESSCKFPRQDRQGLTTCIASEQTVTALNHKRTTIVRSVQNRKTMIGQKKTEVAAILYRPRERCLDR